MAVDTTLQYLARNDLYSTEKPYSAEFEIEESEGVRKTNYILSTEPVTVQAIGPAERPNLDVNGFCVLDEPTKLDPVAALADPEAVEAGYLHQLEAILARHFPQYTRFEPFEFVLRKRDERFPSEDLALIQHEQPACLAHSDYSVRGAWLQLESSFPGQGKYFQDKEFDMINVWRPLVGPNNDWPLAVCDYTSIDREGDVITADRLLPDRVGENQLLLPSPRHRWFYVQAQQPHQLLVFRNIDSTGQRAMAFHAAFFNPDSTSAPRQSCEARFVAIR